MARKDSKEMHMQVTFNINLGEAFKKKIRDYLGIFPKCQAPPPPFWERFVQNEIFWVVFVKNLVCFMGDFRVI